MVTLTVLLVGSYLLGSIPFGYLAGRLAGIDIREAGSGNVGATNVVRVLGKKYGYPVFALDVLKGFGAVKIAMLMALTFFASKDVAEALRQETENPEQGIAAMKNDTVTCAPATGLPPISNRMSSQTRGPVVFSRSSLPSPSLSRRTRA